jgi:hypothetical protein
MEDCGCRQDKDSNEPGRGWAQGLEPKTNGLKDSRASPHTASTSDSSNVGDLHGQLHAHRLSPLFSTSCSTRRSPGPSRAAEIVKGGPGARDRREHRSSRVRAGRTSAQRRVAAKTTGLDDAPAPRARRTARTTAPRPPYKTISDLGPRLVSSWPQARPDDQQQERHRLWALCRRRCSELAGVTLSALARCPDRGLASERGLGRGGRG